ncbi:MAG: HAD family hydrolase [Anaplasmataceae bacterium]|nr:HAD family hydrolase [Anaplasmataceae bacterium]
MLDRDGVICKYLNRYLLNVEEFELLKGVDDLIKEAKARNFIVVVITNQPQVGKKLLSESALQDIHHLMLQKLNHAIDRVYVCPHRTEDNCLCRKPSPGMLLKAQEDFNLNLSSSIFIGDSDTDIQAGKEVGCQTIFIKNEYNQHKLQECHPHYVIETLEEAIFLLD